MSPLRIFLLVVVILMLVGTAPMWPYATTWGYAPSGGFGTLLLVLVVLMLLDEI